MPVTVLIGCQWGDEGKGKIIDLLSAEADWVARFQGGANAGHTVQVGSRTAVLHLVPSGILRPGVRCAIGNGVVLDPLALSRELDLLQERGIAWRDRLQISAVRIARSVRPSGASVRRTKTRSRARVCGLRTCCKRGASGRSSACSGSAFGVS